MWRAVELSEIRVFLLLAEELHFGRTAARAGLSQPRVSQSVRSLERKLGAELAVRTSRRVTLTVAGERFRDRAAPALAALEAVLRDAETSGDRVTEPVRLGVVTATAMSPRLRSIIEAFESAYPESTVALVGLPFHDRFGPLRRGEVDLMVTSLPVDEPDLVTGFVLRREPRMLAVGRGHPLAGRQSASIEDLADYPIGRLGIRAPRAQVEAMTPSRTPSGRPVRMTPLAVSEPSELIWAVASGRVVQPVSTTFTETYSHPDVVYLPIRDLPPIRSALVWRRRDPNRGLRAFLQEAENLRRRERQRRVVAGRR